MTDKVQLKSNSPSLVSTVAADIRQQEASYASSVGRKRPAKPLSGGEDIIYSMIKHMYQGKERATEYLELIFHTPFLIISMLLFRGRSWAYEKIAKIDWKHVRKYRHQEAGIRNRL